MSAGDRFESASGLRPASAFVLIGAVLCLVGLRGAKIAVIDEGEQPRNLTQLEMPEVTFDLLDTRGLPLALSVESLELVMSPNAMWQAHTPDKIAAELSRALGGSFAAEHLLERMLPEARLGVIRVDAHALRMNARQAARVDHWIRSGSVDLDASPVRIEGFWIHPLAVAGEFGLTWVPRVVLSEDMRQRHGVSRPLDWSRRIADDLTACIASPEALDSIDTEDERKAWRKAIWDALLPSQFKSVIKEVPAATALAVHDLLESERIQSHQMSLRRHAKRMYPVQAADSADPQLSILGRWGTLEPETAREIARKELRLPGDEHCTEQELELLKSLTCAKVYQPSPMSGLELLCQRLLEQPAWQFLVRKPEEYTFLANQVPRQAPARYFQELIPASETPRVVTTIDLELQRQLRAWLEHVMAEQHPAVVQAIVVDVDTAAVLAVDALDPYDAGGFLPTMHTFTPGSTTKVLVMATALDVGVVAPASTFDTGDGHFKIESRQIHEAEGALTGRISAAQGLAYSINAVLVQIGLRVPAAVLHERFCALGYGAYPATGLGGERSGRVPSLPWKARNEHASVSFGHELMVTLWQQAAALCTVIRGGEYRPLRVVDAIEQNGVRHALALADAKRVFGADACALVREMMFMGAREGTGKKVYCDDIEMGTKTGTAQKVPGEVCLHAELAHNREHQCRGARACRAKLAGVRPHKSSCYTSSMCIFGRLPGSPREIMVLVVVDEPRGGKKYGSDVAGPAAAGILKEALGTRATGAEPVRRRSTVSCRWTNAARRSSPGAWSSRTSPGWRSAVRLAELVHELGGSLSPSVGDGPKVTGVHLDSRRAGAGDLFAALPGTHADGARFALDALARGAVAVLTPRALELRSTAAHGSAAARDVLQWIHPQARAIAGRGAAARVYGDPAQGMFVVGITGTNGKTTTAHLTGQLLRASGKRPAVLGTAGHRLADGRLVHATHTTPDAPEPTRLLAEHREMGGDCVALEASSHALDQERTAGLTFDVAIFTNLTRDHLDYHDDLEHYAAAKERLFGQLRSGAAAVVNADDPISERMSRAAQAAGARVYTYSARLRGDLCASHLQTDLRGSHFFLNGMGISRSRVHLPLAGRFNVENALAAAAAALLSGASPANILEGLATASAAPGRLESVPTAERGFSVLVDYAHSEAALENVCRIVKRSLAQRRVANGSAAARRGNLIVVFGCGGDRDQGKRGPMGRVANEFADLAIVTSDNPRSEDPDRILADIVAGMEPALARRVLETDRRRAIHMAIEAARPGDVVLIAGKGHETTQTIGSSVLEFDDRRVASEALQ